MSASEQFSPLSNIPNVHGAYQPQVGFNRLNMFNHMAVALRKRKRGGTTNPCDPRKPLIRVYTGGAMNIGQTHVGLFDTALENAGLLEKGWTIERLSSKNIRETKCDWDSPKYLVDWLLEADIHVILIQGLRTCSDDRLPLFSSSSEDSTEVATLLSDSSAIDDCDIKPYRGNMRSAAVGT